MKQTAKLFMNGRSQAVRLPVDFRFDCDEVYISHDLDTGDVVLSKKPGDWADFFALVDTTPVPQDFMADREQEDSPQRDLF
jgi:antitoxin VapB